MPSEGGPTLAGCQASVHRASCHSDTMPCAADLERHEHGPLDLHEGIRTPPLDKHEGIGHPDPLGAGCKRWPEALRLLNHSTGELVPGRCRATNLCPYCARLFAVETSEMLALDAVEDAPSLYLVLTAREHLTRAACTTVLRHLRRSLRRRWPDVRWATTVEFQRRGALHLNLLLKGVPAGDLDELHEAAVAIWCARVDASPAGQWSDVIADGVGVVRYISLHFLKTSQAPVIGWKGHRYSSTRDYLVRPAAIMREEARRSLRLKRLMHGGLDAQTAELELSAADLVTWELRHVSPSDLLRRVGVSACARAEVNPAQRAT